MLELRKIINDFNLDNFQKYKINLDNINKNKKNNYKKRLDNENYRVENNNNENNIETNNNSKTSSNDTSTTNKYRIKSSKNNNRYLKNNKHIIIEPNNLQTNVNNNNKSIKSRNKGTNNSSQNYLVRSSTSQFFKDRLNNNLIGVNNEVIASNNPIINIQKKNKKILNSQENEEEKINYQDILLNRTYKGSALLIKIFILSILLLLIIILIVFYFKIEQFLILKNGIYEFFYDFYVISKRFSLLHYFFNTFRTFIVFKDDNTNDILKNILDNLDELYEKENKEYINVINNIEDFFATKDLFKIISTTKNNSTQIIKEKICGYESLCINYLNSNYNIFDSGIDFAYKSCITQIGNLYKDYQKLKNKTDIKEIKEKIVDSSNKYFTYITFALSNIIFYVEENIFQSFQIDQNHYIYYLTRDLTILNIFSILFSMSTILYINVFIFISISRFSRPIKESTYRTNCSFYYIKKYSLSNIRTMESISS